MARWVFSKQDSQPLRGPEGIPQTILQILKERGVDEFSAIQDFLSSFPKTTHDPFLLPDMREAVDLILKTADSGGRICIYGDYDADGVTSVSLLLTVFRKLTDKVCYYIPSRFREGYGLNCKAIKAIADEGASLIVTVDCGSSSPGEIKYARSLGVEMIVTDHHNPSDDTLPDCLFINPKRKGSRYPFKELSGCGVAFKLAQSLQRVMEIRGDERFSKAELNALLDLVAISTVADVVPLLDENRTLVKYGLDRINRHERPGLTALLSVLEFGDKKIDAEHIAFILAPNINALGRMQSADIGAELLCDDGKSVQQLVELARRMLENNKARKTEQEKTKALCETVIAEGKSGEWLPVIYAQGAHEGVAGIVAGNLKEALYRPVFIATLTEEGLIKGTGRSIPGLNLHEMLSKVSHLFVRFGGHAGACGFSMIPENLEVFRESMQEAVISRLAKEPDLLEEQLYVTKKLASDEKSLTFAKLLRQLEPYGEENQKPLFCAEGVRICSVCCMGQEEQHVRFLASDQNGAALSCVLFRRAKDFADILDKGVIIDVVGELTVNEFRDSEKVQMIVRDIKRSNSTWSV
jgi:single-stranded-DNA-specific exonuclease